MRVCLLTHALTPYEVTGVENHTAQLARGLAQRGVEVQVFAPGPAMGTWRLSQRLEERDGYEIFWLALGERQPDEEGNEPGAAEAFGRYLDRERPDLVHAQHLIGLGPDLVSEAKRRGMPFLFTAHDAWLVSEEYRLLRPDFVALDPKDTEAMGRVLLARRLLDRLLPEADHQGLVLPGDLSEDAQALLAEVLDGDPLRAGFEAEEVDGMRRRAERGRSARLEAVRAMDMVLSPTRFLAKVLRDGGVTGPLEVEACGVDLAPFAEPRRTPRPLGAPLRVAFLGGVSKHKGLHDLLEAVDGLTEVQLHVYGCSSDRSFSERCRARAAEVGAEWRGAFDASALPNILSQTDVIVVPSKWPENAPFVIREAFAAGVPVVAADVGAMSESLCDGEDGWLFPAGDVAALRSRLKSLADHPALLEEGAAAVRSPRSIEEQAEGLVGRYEQLLPTAAGRPLGRLQHLDGFTRRFEAAQDARWDELVEGTLRGYGRLCEALTGERSSGERVMRAIAKGSRLRERLAEGARAQAWLGRAVEEARQQEGELLARARWQAGDHTALLEKSDWLEGQLAARVEEIAALTSERDGAHRERDQSLFEKSAASKELESKDAELRWLRDQLEFARGEAERVAAERDLRERDLNERTHETEWLQGELAARDETLRESAQVLDEGETLAAEARWLRGQLEFARGESERVAAERGIRERDLKERTEEAEWLRGELADRDERLKQGAELSTALEAVGAEVRWLRDQLEFAREDTARLEGALGERTRDLEERGCEAEWLKGELAERDKRLAHSAKKLRDAERARSSSAAEGEHRRSLEERAQDEAAWREAQLSARSAELEEERRRLGAEEEVRTHLQAEVSWLRETHEALREELSFLRTEVDVREEERARWKVQMDNLMSQQRRLLEHELWLRGELRRLLDAVSGEADGELAPEEVSERVSAAVEAMRPDEASGEER